MGSIQSILEQFFDLIGMMQGEGAIMKRFIFGAGIGFIAFYLLKPNIMFDEKGMRPWILLHSSENSTWVPYWLGSLLVGTFPALLV